MPVSSKHRWVACGKITLRRYRDKKQLFSEFQIEKLIEAVSGRLSENDVTRKNDERMMWIVDSSSDLKSGYTRLLFSLGDKTTSDASYVNFDTKASREIKKDPNEGGHVSSHVLIKNSAESDGSFLIFVEYNHGITLNALSYYFNWILDDERYYAPVTDKGKNKNVRIVTTIVGYANRTLAEALTTGTLKDVEFVGLKETDASHDEDGLIQEVVDSEIWKVNQSLSDKLLGNFADLINRNQAARKKLFKSNDVFVRVKTEFDQIKTTQIESTGDDILQQAFVENAKIEGFRQPLPQRYIAFNEQIIEKMLKIAGNRDGETNK